MFTGRRNSVVSIQGSEVAKRTAASPTFALTRAKAGFFRRLKSAAGMANDPMQLLRYAVHRTIENHYERHFGIDTGHEVMLDALGVIDPDAVRYSPTQYPAFFKAMKLVGANLPTSTLVDYGSGMGRAVVCAATMPLRRVIGVELVEELDRRAKLNISSAQHRFKCKNVSTVVANAMDWPVGPHVNIFHFYNPFLNDTLKGCIGQIAKSLRDHPREAWIVFGCPWQMSRLLAAGEIIPNSWQKESRDSRWPFNKDISAKDPDGYRYRIYRIRSS